MKRKTTVLLEDEEKSKLMAFSEKKEGLFAYVEQLVTAAYRAGQAFEGIKEKHIMS